MMRVLSTRDGKQFFRGMLLALLSAQAGLAVPVFVDAGASGTNDGTSWPNAYRSLQDALLVPGPVEIWVAAGTYTPAPPAGDRNSAFRIQSGQELYGGFSGTESMRGERDPTANQTILSGDLNGDDLPGFEGSAENAYHVLRVSNADSTAVVDGFTVLHGSASLTSGFNSAGGGLLLQNSSARFIRCRFVENFARSGGAAVVLGGSPEFSNCAFLGNFVQNGRGGAVSVGGSSFATLADCAFVGNTVRGGVGANDGGALYVDLGGEATLTRCLFEGNSSTSSSRSLVATGGAISNLGSRLDIVSSTFRRNTANVGGGIWAGKDTLMANCDFDRNEAIVGEGGLDQGGVGGALVAFMATATVAGCTLVGNQADDGGGLYSSTSATINVSNSILWGNRDGSGTTALAQLKGPGAKSVRYTCLQNLLTPVPGEDPPDPANFPGSTDADPLLVDADGPDNVAGTGDDNLRLLGGSPCIDAGENASLGAGITEDIDGGPRRRDDPGTPDTGSGSPPVVDMGAHEFGGSSATGTVTINAGAAFTSSPDVTLGITVSSGSGVTKVRFSGDGTTWSPWQALAPETAWTLYPGDGTKTVRARFGDAAGTVLAEAADSIVLDATPPDGSISINSGVPTTPTTAAVLSLAASDSGSGVSDMRLSNDGISWSAWETFGASRPWELSAGPGLKTVRVQYRDVAGNASGAFSDDITLEAPPEPQFLRGDSNTDGGVDISDSVRILLSLFVAGRELACEDAADVDDGGSLNLTDAIYGLNWLFLQQAPPPPPVGFGPEACSPDPTTDGLGCAAYTPCGN